MLLQRTARCGEPCVFGSLTYGCGVETCVFRLFTCDRFWTPGPHPSSGVSRVHLTTCEFIRTYVFRLLICGKIFDRLLPTQVLMRYERVQPQHFNLRPPRQSGALLFNSFEKYFNSQKLREWFRLNRRIFLHFMSFLADFGFLKKMRSF